MGLAPLVQHRSFRVIAHPRGAVLVRTVAGNAFGINTVNLSLMPNNKQADTDILAAAVIAAGMYANPKSEGWTTKEIAHDAVANLEEIKNELNSLRMSTSAAQNRS
jgi:hypothetical protein